MVLGILKDAKKNSFGDIKTDLKMIVNLLNYRFSKRGDYIGPKQKKRLMKKLKQESKRM